MEVILLEKIAKLGELGDIVNVKPGYARNYLLSHGKAATATAENKQRFAEQRAQLQQQQAAQRQAAQEQATKLQAVRVEIAQRAGVDGRLFGSVTSQDIAKALSEKLGDTLSKQSIRLAEGPLKQLGVHQVEVVLYHDVSVNVEIMVVAE